MSNEFTCPACGAAFPTEAAQREHGSKAHPMPGAPHSHADFDRKQCGGHFHSDADLKAHAAQAHRM